jgi:thiol-disulfide isomerase/thioredoxin
MFNKSIIHKALLIIRKALWPRLSLGLSLSLFLVLSFSLSLSPGVAAESESTDVLMTPISYAEWEIQRQQYLPNVVVVDIWATWCISCIERFPEMVALHNEYKDKNVQFVSMNLDDREDVSSLQKAEKFLAKMNASFDHYRMDENLLHAFEQIDLIGIPAVIIYDREGNEKYRLTGDNPNKQFTEKDIEQALSDLLK